jgi:hypothetical protein
MYPCTLRPPRLLVALAVLVGVLIVGFGEARADEDKNRVQWVFDTSPVTATSPRGGKWWFKWPDTKEKDGMCTLETGGLFRQQYIGGKFNGTGEWANTAGTEHQTTCDKVFGGARAAKKASASKPSTKKKK